METIASTHISAACTGTFKKLTTKVVAETNSSEVTRTSPAKSPFATHMSIIIRGKRKWVTVRRDNISNIFSIA